MVPSGKEFVLVVADKSATTYTSAVASLLSQHPRCAAAVNLADACATAQQARRMPVQSPTQVEQQRAVLDPVLLPVVDQDRASQVAPAATFVLSLNGSDQPSGTVQDGIRTSQLRPNGMLSYLGQILGAIGQTPQTRGPAVGNGASGSSGHDAVGDGQLQQQETFERLSPSRGTVADKGEVSETEAIDGTIQFGMDLASLIELEVGPALANAGVVHLAIHAASHRRALVMKWEHVVQAVIEPSKCKRCPVYV
jgi:hypothetical protein